MKRFTVAHQLTDLAFDVEMDIRAAVPNGWVTESERSYFLDDEDIASWADKAFIMAEHDEKTKEKLPEGRKEFLDRLRSYEIKWMGLIKQL